VRGEASRLRVAQADERTGLVDDARWTDE